MSNVLDTSEIVRRVIREQRLTHKEFAQFAEVTATQVGRWTRRESMPRPRKVTAALERMGLDPELYGLRSTASLALQPLAVESQAKRNEEIVATLYEINAKLDRVLRALSDIRR